MRTIEYLSPTSLSNYLEDKEKFYIDKLAEIRAPRFSQTRPMSIGSAFDAYAKSYLFEKLIGKGDPDWPKFEFDTLFNAQVEECNRDWARIHGKYVFNEYVACGALADMVTELSGSLDKPRFELDMHSTVQTELGIVPLLGKPDVFFVNQEGLSIISDWKVNGYCGRGNLSPKPGYVKILPKYDVHPDSYPIKYKGTTICGNKYMKLHTVEESWARQTVIYAWLCGCPVGSEFVHAIDQVACNNSKNARPGYDYPVLRFAQHRYLCDPDFQFRVFREAYDCWQAVSRGPEHYFSDMSPEDSRNRCQVLEDRAKALYKDSPQDDLFNQICRGR